MEALCPGMKPIAKRRSSAGYIQLSIGTLVDPMVSGSVSKGKGRRSAMGFGGIYVTACCNVEAETIGLVEVEVVAAGAFLEKIELFDGGGGLKGSRL